MCEEKKKIKKKMRSAVGLVLGNLNLSPAPHGTYIRQ